MGALTPAHAVQSAPANVRRTNRHPRRHCVTDPSTSIPLSRPPAFPPAGPEPSAVEGRLDQKTLDRSLVRGVAWTGSVKWITQIVAWVATWMVARVLSPDDYGLVGLAAVYFGFLTLVSEAGLGMTVIALRELDGTRLNEVHTFGALMGIAGFAVSCLVALPIAAFYGEPELRGIVIVMSVNFVVIALRTVPQAVMQRELQFKRFAAIDGVNAIGTAIVSVALAFAGYRYWSLVFGTLVGSFLATGLTLWSRPLGFRWPRIAELRHTLRTSREILISGVAWYVSQSADFVIAGKLLGKTAAGTYTFAWNVAYSLVEKVTALVNGVTSSIFSAAKHDQALLTRYITRITGALAFVLLPATAGVALVANELILAVLGVQWRGAIIPLILLVLYAGVRSLTPILGQALIITGDTKYAMRRNIVGAIVLPVAFFVGAKLGGLVGIAMAWILVHAPVVLVPMFRRVSHHLGIGARDYAPAIMPALVSTAIMAGAVLGVAALVPATTSLLTLLFVKMAVGGITYAAAVWLFFREEAMSLVRVFSQLRSGTPASAAAAEAVAPAP
jgi:O-antigen/teichoic acid export membrane protein